MALVTERIATVRDGWLTVDVEYDDATLRLQTITVTPAIPAGHSLHVALGKGGNDTWREYTFDSTTPVVSESRPFGGGFNDLDQIAGLGLGWEVV